MAHCSRLACLVSMTCLMRSYWTCVSSSAAERTNNASTVDVNVRHWSAGLFLSALRHRGASVSLGAEVRCWRGPCKASNRVGDAEVPVHRGAGLFCCEAGDAGQPGADVGRRTGVSELTYFIRRWRHGDLGRLRMREPPQMLDDEGSRLKRLVADLTLNRLVLDGFRGMSDASSRDAGQYSRSARPIKGWQDYRLPLPFGDVPKGATVAEIVRA